MRFHPIQHIKKVCFRLGLLLLLVLFSAFLCFSSDYESNTGGHSWDVLNKASNAKAMAKAKATDARPRPGPKPRPRQQKLRRTKPKSVHSQKLYNAKKRVHIKQQHLHTRCN